MTSNRDLVHAASFLFDAAKQLCSIRPLFANRLSDYSESLDCALSAILEAASGLLIEMSSRSEYEYFDMGEEPRSKEDAVKILPTFVDTCIALLDKASRDVATLPSMVMGLRAQTFFVLLRDNDRQVSL